MPAVTDEPAAHHQATPPDRGLIRLWVGVLLPPVSWVADFMIRYMAIRFANIHDRRWPMVTSTALAIVMVLVGGALCWRARRQDKREGAVTLAGWGLGLAAFFLLLILAQAFPTLILRPREIT
jgi:hypothetical protein